MAVFSVERHGFISLYDLVASIGADLLDNGFDAVIDSITGPLVDATATATLGPVAPPNSSVTRLPATLGNGVTAIAITNPGTKYDPLSPPTITFSAPAASGYNVMVDAGYTLYSGSVFSTSYWDDPSIPGTPDVTLTSSALNALSKRATGTAVIDQNGTITGITITDPGYGYTQTEAITITITGGHLQSTKYLVESTTAVDPLAGTQPWRIYFDLRGVASPATTSGQLGIYAGTPSTLPNSGTIAYVVSLPNSATATKIEPTGNTGAQWSNNGNPLTTSMDQCFINRAGRSDIAVATAYPMSYRLTITDRGVFLGVWESNVQESGASFNWLLIQRAVDRLSGVTRGSTVETASGQCPVFCLNSVNNKYYKFVVREKDALVPSQRKQADANVEDSSAVINSKNQQSLTESGEYVITFISNLNSSRYKYADELDMIGTVSADVVAPGTSIEVTVYGEAQPRKYRALYSNGANSTGMRLMVLEENPNES